MLTSMIRSLLLLLLYGSIAAAAAAQDDPPPVQLVGQAGQEVISIEASQQRIKELESATDIEEGLRSQLLELYRQIEVRLAARRSHTELAEAYRTALLADPDATARASAELAAARTSPPEGVELPADATDESLQLQLTQTRAELAALRTQATDLEGRLAAERARPIAAGQQLGEARNVLAQLSPELAGPVPSPDDPELARATRWLLVARHRARQAEVAMLEQELLSNPVRITLLETLRDLTAFKTGVSEAKASRLEEWLSQLRKNQADAAVREASRLRREAIGKHPLIVDVIGEITAASHETQRLLGRTDQVRVQRQDVEERLARTEEDYDETRRSLELGITRSLGTVLLEQRRLLPNARIFRRAAVERSDQAMAERLALFTDEREIKALADPSRAARDRIGRFPTDDLTEDRQQDIQAELEGLLATRLEHLVLLQKARRDYLTAIGNLDAREAALLARAGELASILDERLLWIPNAPALNAGTFARLRGDVAWLTSASLWGQALDAGRADLASSYTSYGLVALVLTGLWWTRRRMRRHLIEIATRIGNVRTDSITLTVRALALQVLHTLPIPAAVALLGWRMTQVAESAEAAKAVGSALVTTAVAGFALQVLRDICRDGGIARDHFRWNRDTNILLRRQLLWFMWLALPAAFVVELVQEQSDALLRYSLGRLTFMTLMLGEAVLAWRLLHPRLGLYTNAATRSGSAWLRGSRRLWQPLGVLVPVTLAALAATGYQYAAMQLELRLHATVLIIMAAVLVHALLHRLLLVSQRRLAMKVLLEKRAAAQKSREEGGSEASSQIVLEAPDAIDVVEIKEQSHHLLRVSIGFLVLVASWFAWVSALPALNVLNEVTLWHHSVLIDGVPTQQPTTLTNLGMCLLLILVTITAARNMPGFLEIALLQRLPLEPGARYATRALVLYTIVTTGVVLAFNAIGVGWSSVQWLVAALTVGLGFGLQEIFANFVSGLIILLERPVRVGDTVTVTDVSGVVSRIRMRATTITDWKRRELIVPNKSFITNELVNWSLSDPIMRLEFTVGIAYGSDTVLAHQLMLDICVRHPKVLEQPEPAVFFTEFGDNSLSFEVRVFVTEPNNSGRTRILHDLHMAIDQACREQGVTIAFPQRDLHLKSSDATLRVSLAPQEKHS